MSTNAHRPPPTCTITGPPPTAHRPPPTAHRLALLEVLFSLLCYCHYIWERDHSALLRSGGMDAILATGGLTGVRRAEGRQAELLQRQHEPSRVLCCRD